MCRVTDQRHARSNDPPHPGHAQREPRHWRHEPQLAQRRAAGVANPAFELCGAEGGEFLGDARWRRPHDGDAAFRQRQPGKHSVRTEPLASDFAMAALRLEVGDDRSLVVPVVVDAHSEGLAHARIGPVGAHQEISRGGFAALQHELRAPSARLEGHRFTAAHRVDVRKRGSVILQSPHQAARLHDPRERAAGAAAERKPRAVIAEHLHAAHRRHTARIEVFPGTEVAQERARARAQGVDAHIEFFRQRPGARRSALDEGHRAIAACAGKCEPHRPGARDDDARLTHGAGAPWIMRSASSRRAGGKRSRAARARPRPHVGMRRASPKSDTSRSVKATPRNASRERASR